VLVDKRRGLGPRYKPRDLVTPRVTFLPGTTPEGHRLRRPAARALERLFAAARRDGVRLAGVSGFRSYASQRALFAGYARERGAESAAHVSARAGHSEHQTGLAIDISGADGRCAASRCFAGSRPARWLARHAPEHGFVVRYPRGREHVTGYDHEPWHLRYVGTALARESADTGRTLDELLRR
jgi:zinc D-Ala-D-Ala carboxypeptidase